MSSSLPGLYIPSIIPPILRIRITRIAHRSKLSVIRRRQSVQILINQGKENNSTEYSWDHSIKGSCHPRLFGCIRWPMGYWSWCLLVERFCFFGRSRRNFDWRFIEQFHIWHLEWSVWKTFSDARPEPRPRHVECALSSNGNDVGGSMVMRESNARINFRCRSILFLPLIVPGHQKCFCFLDIYRVILHQNAFDSVNGVK